MDVASTDSANYSGSNNVCQFMKTMSCKAHFSVNPENLFRCMAHAGGPFQIPAIGLQSNLDPRQTCWVSWFVLSNSRTHLDKIGQGTHNWTAHCVFTQVLRWPSRLKSIRDVSCGKQTPREGTKHLSETNFLQTQGRKAT